MFYIALSMVLIMVFMLCMFTNTVHYIERPKQNVTDFGSKYMLLENRVEQLEINYDILLENSKIKPVLLYYNLPIKSIERYYSVLDNTIYASHNIDKKKLNCIVSKMFTDYEVLQQVNLNYDAIAKVEIPKHMKINVYNIVDDMIKKVRVYRMGTYDGKILKDSIMLWIGHIEDTKYDKDRLEMSVCS